MGHGAWGKTASSEQLAAGSKRKALFTPYWILATDSLLLNPKSAIRNPKSKSA
jgi:hypothetical protein